MGGQGVRRLFIKRGGGGGLDPGAELRQVAGLEGETSGSPWGFPPSPHPPIPDTWDAEKSPG